jgi:hypothetical protein
MLSSGELERRPYGRRATAWEPRGAAVDVRPALAAELAVWALEHVKPPQVFVAWR